MGRATVLVGCGRLGSAMVEGWLKARALDPRDLIILTPSDKPVAAMAQAEGARINPPLDQLADAGSLVLAVKPALWREAARPLLPVLARDAVVVSVMAGVLAESLSGQFGDRPVARVMPTTGVASARGAASIWSASEAGRDAALALFKPIAQTVILPDEALMDAATAVSGSGVAYYFAFTAALARAAEAAGLDPATAAELARATLSSAAASAEAAGPDMDALIARVASPGGTTQAGLAALTEGDALDALVKAAVTSAARRAAELSGS